MFNWIKNWVNWAKLGVGALIVALNYALGWGWDAEALATLGGLLAVPVELWDFTTNLIRKLMKREE